MFKSRQRRLILDTILLGIVGALSAQLFTLMLGWASDLFLEGLAGYVPPGLPDEGGVLKEVIGSRGLWLIPLSTTLGGLISGILVYSLAPEAEGHGTDTAVKAFHHVGGYIRARVPPLKMVASAITIGSGGAAGREGPTALISAGIGSIYATVTKRSDEERRLLVLVGMAAGLSAIFRSPIGTAIFAIEILYSGMESDVGALLYTMLGSVVAYAINGLFVGFKPLFDVPAAALVRPGFLDYGWYILLGLVAGVVGTVLPMAFYGVRDLFHQLPGPPHLKPALGGLGVGLLALALPQVLAGGYGWIQEAIDGQLATGLLFTLIFAKLIAFTLTVSSGGSGGVFAPSLFVGAMAGGFMAQVFGLAPAPFVIVGMAAVFSGAARVPMASLLMVLEMTDGFHLLVPAALAVVLSYLLQSKLSAALKYQTLYEMQVPGRPDSPAHHQEHIAAALRLLHGGDVKLPATVDHVNLQALLASGIPIDLPDGKQLAMAVVAPGTNLAGKPLGELFTEIGRPHGVEIAAVMRGNQTLLPNVDVILRPGDQLLAVTAPQVWERLNREFAHLSPQGNGHGGEGVSPATGEPR